MILKRLRRVKMEKKASGRIVGCGERHCEMTSSASRAAEAERVRREPKSFRRHVVRADASHPGVCCALFAAEVWSETQLSLEIAQCIQRLGPALYENASYIIHNTETGKMDGIFVTQLVPAPAHSK